MVKRLKALPIERVVLEATGGFEAAVVAGLAAAALPVIVINPRQVRDFAKASARLAKPTRSMPPYWSPSRSHPARVRP